MVFHLANQARSTELDRHRTARTPLPNQVRLEDRLRFEDHSDFLAERQAQDMCGRFDVADTEPESDKRLHPRVKVRSCPRRLLSSIRPERQMVPLPLSVLPETRPPRCRRRVRLWSALLPQPTGLSNVQISPGVPSSTPFRATDRGQSRRKERQAEQRRHHHLLAWTMCHPWPADQFQGPPTEPRLQLPRARSLHIPYRSPERTGSMPTNCCYLFWSGSLRKKATPLPLTRICDRTSCEYGTALNLR